MSAFRWSLWGIFLLVLFAFQCRPSHLKSYSNINTCITIHGIKIMIPVWELFPLWVCLGKQLLILSNILPCFPSPGQCEAGLTKSTEIFISGIFCPHPGPHGRGRRLQTSGGECGLLPATEKSCSDFVTSCCPLLFVVFPKTLPTIEAYKN